MAPIEWTSDGPVGSEPIEFSRDGVRLAVLTEKGGLEDIGHYELKMLGGVLPNVGDRLVTLWWRDDPDNEEHYRVLGRYYIGEFGGDNCWWLVLSTEPTVDRDKRLFRLARKASAETRKLEQARSRHQTVDFEKLLERLRRDKVNKRKGRAAPRGAKKGNAKS